MHGPVAAQAVILVRREPPVGLPGAEFDNRRRSPVCLMGFLAPGQAMPCRHRREGWKVESDRRPATLGPLGVSPDGGFPPGPDDLLLLRGWGMPARPLLRGFSRAYVRARESWFLGRSHRLLHAQRGGDSPAIA
jgi:hypothetical protein